MLSEQQLVQLADDVGNRADGEWGHKHCVTGRGLADYAPYVELGFRDRDDQFVVRLSSLGEFWYREMVRVVGDDLDVVISAEPKAIVDLVFNS